MRRTFKSALTILFVALAIIYFRGLYLNYKEGGDATAYTKNFPGKVVETLKSINISSLIKRSSNPNIPEDVSPGTNPSGNSSGKNNTNNDTAPDPATSINNFNNLLNSRIRMYFSTDLPKEEGESKKVSINDLIKSGKITNDDLKYVGSNCSGDAYVTKANNNFYYWNDIRCGTYSSDAVYGEWSKTVDSLPNLSGKNYQVIADILYNYKYSGGMSSTKYTSWSNWAESETSVNKPSVPSGATIIDTEKENKTQYRSRTREAVYQWYRITNANEYYNNGAYYESTPAAGYLKDYATKTYSRDSLEYVSMMALKGAEPGTEDTDIVEVTKHDMAAVRSKYMYTLPEQTVNTSECETSRQVTQYQCYTNISNVTGPYESSGTYSSKSKAVEACKSQQSASASTCEGYLYQAAVPGTEQCTETQVSGTYYFEVKFNGKFIDNNGKYLDFNDCGVICTTVPVGKGYSCGDWRIADVEPIVRACLKNFKAYNDGNGSNGYNKCPTDESKRAIISGKISDSSGDPTKKIQLYSLRKVTYCSLSSNGDGKIETSCTTVGGSAAKYKYRYYKTTKTKSYDSGYYTTCPSGYTRDTSKSRVVTECTKYKTKTTPATTYYLKSNGSVTTNINEAALLTESEFENLKKQNSTLNNYVKVGSSTTTSFSGKYIDGPCPSGTNSSNCKTQTFYKAKLYKYKWYKVNTGVREYCNNGELTSNQPASGCIKDESSIRYTAWGAWSGYSDNVISKTVLKDVETKTFVRIRYAYVTTNEEVSTGWITKAEMETATGKKINELIGLQSKAVYRYRIKK